MKRQLIVIEVDETYQLRRRRCIDSFHSACGKFGREHRTKPDQRRELQLVKGVSKPGATFRPVASLLARMRLRSPVDPQASSASLERRWSRYLLAPELEGPRIDPR